MDRNESGFRAEPADKPDSVLSFGTAAATQRRTTGACEAYRVR
jgi:hypothetical protein